MEFMQVLQTRRAVKSYVAEQPLADSVVTELLDAATLTPTSFNIQHWRFVVVRDMAKRQQIRAAAWNQAQVTDAGLLLVLCADTQAWAKQPDRYWANAPSDVQNLLVPMLQQFYKDQPQLQRDEAMRTVGMAAQTIMLKAVDMGYDSCPMIGFDAQKVAEIINLPADHVIGMVIAIGKKADDAKPKPSILPLADVMVIDGF
jgi:nitroreductase